MLHIETRGNRPPASNTTKGVVLGPTGIGKTTLLKTLDPDTTLFFDMEAGHLAVRDWDGDRIDVFQQAQALGMAVWDVARGLAVWMGGPSPLSTQAHQTYSLQHYNDMCGIFGDPAALAKYDTIFVDSITVASRACLKWAQTQPEAFSEKTGKPDNRGAYGLLGQEMKGWLTQLQHVTGKNVWLVGILEQHKDDYGRASWVPQIEGAATAMALPGIVDEVISMVELADESGQKFRAFVCHSLNQWGYPAKDRSGALDVIEEPHLGRLMEKLRSAPSKVELTYAMPAAQPTPTAT